MLLCPVKQPRRKTQGFGERPDVYAQFGLKGHNGIDFAGEHAGEKVRLYAPIEGYLELGDQGNGGYGKYVRIRSKQLDDQGRRKDVILGHLDSFAPNIHNGMFIPLGECVGIMGTTGFSSGVHVHCGLRFLREDGSVLDSNNGYAGYVDFDPWVIDW